MAYYDFLKNQWIMKAITADQLDAAVTKGYITLAQCDEIKATEQMA